MSFRLFLNSACLIGSFGWLFLCVWLLVQPQRIGSNLYFSEFSSFHGWLDWRSFHPDSRANWHGLLVHHSRHPLSGADYSQTVAPFPVGGRVILVRKFILVSILLLGLFSIHLEVGSLVLVGRNSLFFSFSGIGACCQLATRATWPLALVFK